jgi:alcohol dehydrogenase (NADP+)
MKTPSIQLQSGDSVPVLGLGTWQNENSIQPAIDCALECGYRHIDCAAIYKNEKEIGESLKTLCKKKHIKREDLWLTSKLWNSFHAEDAVRKACKQTLHDLKCDHLDLYLMHWPVAQKESLGLDLAHKGSDFLSLDDIPLSETFSAMQQLIDEGLVKNIGVSNFSIRHLQQLIEKTGITPSVNQVECHPYLAQNKLSDFCKKHRIAVTAYSPLGASGRPQRMQGTPQPRLLDAPVITRIADEKTVSAAQILLAWNRQRGRVVIPKSANVDRIIENYRSLEVDLSDDEMQQINAKNEHHRYIDGSFYCSPGSPYTLEMLWGGDDDA